MGTNLNQVQEANLLLQNQHRLLNKLDFKIEEIQIIYSLFVLNKVKRNLLIKKNE